MRLILTLLLLTAQPHPTMIWDGGCLTSVTTTANTYLEAPLRDDGTPDMSRAKLVNVVVKYDPACGHIRVR